jgi:hypothetical protein
MSKEPIPRLTIYARLPGNLAKNIKKLAKLDKRSVNAFVELALDNYVRDRLTKNN